MTRFTWDLLSEEKKRDYELVGVSNGDRYDYVLLRIRPKREPQ